MPLLLGQTSLRLPKSLIKFLLLACVQLGLLIFLLSNLGPLVHDLVVRELRLAAHHGARPLQLISLLYEQVNMLPHLGSSRVELRPAYGIHLRRRKYTRLLLTLVLLSLCKAINLTVCVGTLLDSDLLLQVLSVL